MSIDIDIFVNCHRVDTRWQQYSTVHIYTGWHPVAAVQYSTHLHGMTPGGSSTVQYTFTRVDTRWQQYSTVHIYTGWHPVAAVQYSTVHIYTGWHPVAAVQYSTHLHTNNTQNNTTNNTTNNLYRISNQISKEVQKNGIKFWAVLKRYSAR
jgi:hypothetical protein